MNREDIIRMALEAGFVDYELDDYTPSGYDIRYECFASLVAAAERNSWPAEMEAMERQVNILTDALAQAKAEEREACARVCDDINARYKWPQDTAEKVASQWCADAIRARGQA